MVFFFWSRKVYKGLKEIEFWEWGYIKGELAFFGTFIGGIVGWIFGRLVVVFGLVLVSSLAFADLDSERRASCEAALELPTDFVDPGYLSQHLQEFDALSPEVRAVLRRERVVRLLSDSSRPLSRQKLLKVMADLSSLSTTAELNAVLVKHLTNRVPLNQIWRRVQGLTTGADLFTLEQALGHKTLEEMQELVYGRDPLNPSPESLIGQYLSETHAGHLQRSYPLGPVPEHGVGAPKLTVAITADVQELWRKYFDFPELLLHYHTPNQGTLLIYFNGLKISYAGQGTQPRSETTFTSPGMLLPTILLSTDEADRLSNYLRLGQVNGYAKTPWLLPGYCAVGGYDSCTHWFGEMPIGETRVHAYTFPGHVDHHASNAVQSSEPQSAPLGKYWEDPGYTGRIQQAFHQQLSPNQLIDPGVSVPFTAQRFEMLDRMTRQVWTVPGRQHFADLLGEEAAKLRGEFANPGYVALVLLGRVQNTRVPVVFRAQGGLALDPNFDLMIHAY